MVKIKLLFLLCVLFSINACSLIGKKDKNPEIADNGTTESEQTISDQNAADEDTSVAETDVEDTETDAINNDSSETESSIEDIDDLFETDDLSVSNQDITTNPIASADELDVYEDVIQSMQDEITRLRSQLDTATEEIYKLKAKSQIWENPFSIYNKEIILTNGSTVYGNITYQDQDILFVETLIGGLTLQRNAVKRVIENVTQIPDSSNADNATRRDDIIEIKKDEDGTIFEPSTKLLANAILLGDVTEEVDFRGNRILSGDIKNIGEARADFVKINFIFRMNWQGTTKSLTAFVRGSKHVFLESNIESDSSIEIGAVANFELVVPQDFGTFIGYSYTIDWEQYDE